MTLAFCCLFSPGGGGGDGGVCVCVVYNVDGVRRDSYHLMLPADGEWGDYRDGRWTGVVGQIDRKASTFTDAEVCSRGLATEGSSCLVQDVFVGDRSR